jgi:hypothetical protein
LFRKDQSAAVADIWLIINYQDFFHITCVSIRRPVHYIAGHDYKTRDKDLQQMIVFVTPFAMQVFTFN